MASQVCVSVKHRRNVYSRFTLFIHFIYIIMYLIFYYLLMTFQTMYRFIRYLSCVYCIGKIIDRFYWFYERKLRLGNIFNSKNFYLFILVKDWNKILGSFLIFVYNRSSDTTISHCMLNTRMSMYIHKLC